MACNLYQTIRAHAQANGQKIAVVCDHERLTRMEFLGLVDGYRDRLPPGKRQVVALILPNGPHLPALFVAATSLGHAVQILNIDWPDDLILRTVETLKPDLVISQKGPIEGLDARSLADLQAQSPLPENDYLSEDTTRPFYTGFTSGSTGGPKGFVRSQQSWLDSFAADQDIFDFREDDVFIVPGSLAHSLGFYATLRGLYQGATTVLCAAHRPDRILQTMRQYRGSVVYATPTQIRSFLDVQIRDRLVLPAVRLVLSSGSKFPVAWQNEVPMYYPQSTLYEFYGTSELSYITCGPMAADKSASNVGQPFKEVKIRIVGKHGQALTAGETGEIFVKSNFMFSGYALAGGHSSLVGCTLIDGYLGIGDSGFIDPDGDLHLVGRFDRMLLSSGRNIFPEEIEAVMHAFPALTHAAVFGEDDYKRGRRLVAVLLASDDFRLIDLIAWCRKKLPDYSIPRWFYQVKNWPYTPSGKTDLPRLETDLRTKALDRVR